MYFSKDNQYAPQKLTETAKLQTITLCCEHKRVKV